MPTSVQFETSLILRFALTILAVGFLFSGIMWIAYRFYQRLRRRQIILYLVLFVCSTLSAHLVHAYAAASNQFSIQNVATCLPQFYPLTANKLMAKLGIIHHPVSHPQLNDNTTLNTGITYPLHPLISNDTVSRKNIIFILLDSWNPRIFDTETMPNLSGFATRSSVFIPSSEFQQRYTRKYFRLVLRNFSYLLESFRTIGDLSFIHPNPARTGV